MKTRSKPKPKAAAAASGASQSTKKLLIRDNNPSRLFILPKTLGADATIVTLAHPRTLRPARYYFCPKSGIYEIKQASVGGSAYKSWLLEASRNISTSAEDEKEEQGSGEEVADAQEVEGSSLEEGYVLKTPELFTATSIDPLYLVLPALSPIPSASNLGEQKTLFLSSDDLFESLFEKSKHFRDVLANTKTRYLLERRISAICDTVDAGDEKMYRLSNTKLLTEFVQKASRIVENGLPRSMEDKFVTKPLERPVLAVRREVTEVSDVIDERQGDGEAEVAPTETLTSQSSTATPLSLESQRSTSTAITIPDEPSEDSLSPELVQLQRFRVALDFIMSSYVPPHLAQTLNEILNSTGSPMDFAALNAHLAEIIKLKVEAAAQRSLGDFTRKRGFEEEEAALERQEKKRKLEEEDKRKKANESRGVKDLKKVNVSGMKKMSDFFKKAPAKAK